MESFKTLSPEQVALLQSPLPEEAIKQHPTKTYLSSIKAIYVIERLNQVFGIGSWRIPSEILSVDHGMVVVKAHLHIDEYNIHLEAYGGNDNGGEDNNKNFDLGDAYKGAVTDAFTKMCSYLEIGKDVFKGLNNPPQEKAKPKYIFGKYEEGKVEWATKDEFDRAIKWHDSPHTEKELEAYMKRLSQLAWKNDWKKQIVDKLELKQETNGK